MDTNAHLNVHIDIFLVLNYITSSTPDMSLSSLFYMKLCIPDTEPQKASYNNNNLILSQQKDQNFFVFDTYPEKKCH